MGHRSSKKPEPGNVGVVDDPFGPAMRDITDVELLSVDGDTGGVGGVILPNKKMAVSDLSTPGDVVMASNGEQFRVHVEPVGDQHGVTIRTEPSGGAPGFLTSARNLDKLDAGILKMLERDPFELSPAVVAAIANSDDTAHYAVERAAATDAGASAAEDKMDQYERLLDAGEVRPIEVLCRAAMHSPPPAPFYGICGAYLRKRKGVQCADRNRARQMVKRWVEEGLPVPLAAWDLLVAALPASKLKERLHAMREVRS